MPGAGPAVPQERPSRFYGRKKPIMTMDIYEQLRRDEGLRLKPYLDQFGNTTIGYGRNLTGKGITVIEAEYLLSNDVPEVTDTLVTRLPWYSALDAAQRGVLQNMCFNLGFVKLEEFEKMFQAIAQGDRETAAQEMLSSAWAKEVGDRAVRLAQQMRTGKWT